MIFFFNLAKVSTQTLALQTSHNCCAFPGSLGSCSRFLPRPATQRPESQGPAAWPITVPAPVPFSRLHVDPLIKLGPFLLARVEKESQPGKQTHGQTQSAAQDLCAEHTEEFHMPAIKMILEYLMPSTHSSILAWRSPMDRGAWWVTVHGVAKSQT